MRWVLREGPDSDTEWAELVPVRSLCNGSVIADVPEGVVRALALHGWARDRSDLAPPLKGLPVAFLDLPGFGSSPPPPTAWGGDDYADLVAEAIEGAFRPPLAILAHSFGGRVAVCLAARRPDLVAGLVLCGVPLVRLSPAARANVRYRVVRVGHRFGLVSDAKLERWRQRYGSEDYRRAGGVMRDVLVRVVNESYEGQLPRLKMPVTLLWGDRDTTVPVAVALAAAELIGTHCKVVVLEGVGHDVHREAAEVVRDHFGGMLEASNA